MEIKVQNSSINLLIRKNRAPAEDSSKEVEVTLTIEVVVNLNNKEEVDTIVLEDKLEVVEALHIISIQTSKTNKTSTMIKTNNLFLLS